MELISQFQRDQTRLYSVPKRSRANSTLPTFIAKPSSAYLDYSIDFSRQLDRDDFIHSGSVTVNGLGITLEAVYADATYLTAFISGGLKHGLFYLTFTAFSAGGSCLSQEIMLPTRGEVLSSTPPLSFLAIEKTDHPSPDTKPPLNAISINNRPLIDTQGNYIVG